MPLSHGCNHVTIVTGDIDRLIAFYVDHFQAEVKIDLKEEDLRHALIDLGNGFCLHPFQLRGTPSNASGQPQVFKRGHIDHFAINFSNPANFEEVRERLVEAGASTGRIRDFGAVKVMAFEDPDGMECELALWDDGEALSMAESRLEEYGTQ